MLTLTAIPDCSELSRFIASGRLHCTIDKVNGVVETNRPSLKNAQYETVIRQGDILFVQISLDPALCADTALDGGVKYAIRTDGRILRRLFDGEPESLEPEPPAKEPSTHVSSSQVGATAVPRATGLPSSWFDIRALVDTARHERQRPRGPGV